MLRYFMYVSAALMILTSLFNEDIEHVTLTTYESNVHIALGLILIAMGQLHKYIVEGNLARDIGKAVKEETDNLWPHL